MIAAHGRRSGVLALTFAVAFIVLFLAPPFLPYRFDPYPLVNWADVVDLATPLVLIPLYWLLLTDRAGALTTRWMIVFLLLAAAWVEGHGIHLIANATGHLLNGQSGRAVDLNGFADEVFSHYVWHAAALALSALIMFRAAREDEAEGPVWMGLAAAAIYGFAVFLIGDEGGTPPLGVPFCAAVTVAAWTMRRRLLASPTLTMFGLGYAFALLLFAIWFVIWHGTLPQFSHLGWIK